jgi:hypothetical protein
MGDAIMARRLRFQCGWIVTVVTASAVAQPSEPTPYPVQSGVYDNSESQFISAHVGTVMLADAPWLRVHVGEFDLGKNSYVLFTSMEDGYRLRHSAATLSQWRGWSAFFNGDAVDVELYIAPGDQGVFVDIDDVLVGVRASATVPESTSTIEGDSAVARDVCSQDLRVPSAAKRVGRGITNDPSDPRSGCTNWIIANGAILTAGHCWPSMGVVEFDIPASDCDGTVNFGDPDHQYAFDTSTFNCDTGLNCQSDGLGADWSIRSVFPNPNTGLMPAYGEGAFARLARDLDIVNPSTVRMTGCGVDDVPAGCTGGFNTDSKTRQTSTGDFVGENSDSTGTWIEYDIYGRNALSGAPIFDVALNVAIGIHTNSTEGGSCPSGGTSFNHNSLELAINTFPGANTVYVDQGHPIGLQTGKIFRPWLVLDAALADVPSGGILSIVEGDYTLTSGVINQAVTITAPVGPVSIHP